MRCTAITRISGRQCSRMATTDGRCGMHGGVRATTPDPVERFLQMRFWYRLSPRQQANFFRHPSSQPRLFKPWSRLSPQQRAEVTGRARATGV